MDDWEPDDIQTRGRERRRTARTLSRVRVRLEPADGPAFEGVTVVINHHGAMILSPRRFERGEVLQVTNLDRDLAQTFQVVWCGDAVDGRHKLGLEMLDPGLDFWGPAYQPHQAYE